MRYLKYSALLFVLLFAANFAQAQVSVGIGVGPVLGAIGPAPVCAFGYYGFFPYACAPFGYYGPSYFVGGVFIGAGPWFHGWGHGYYGRYGYYGSGFYGGHGYYGRSTPYARGYANGYGNRPGYGYRGQWLPWRVQRRQFSWWKRLPRRWRHAR